MMVRSLDVELDDGVDSARIKSLAGPPSNAKALAASIIATFVLALLLLFALIMLILYIMAKK